MDFHSLARKELQTLCKKNKIPANMTNVAMADALQALQHVEGLDELLNPSESDLPQTPAKTVIGASDIPLTACRTSTRRKPIKEPESSHPLTRTRLGARKTVSEEPDQEKKCASVHETVSEKNVKNVPGQEKSGVPKTPAALSSRRKARPAASACKKMDAQKEETTVKPGYSTRRSVRFLEKNMAELSLKEKERIEPVMFEELSEDVEEKDAPGTDLQTVSEDDSAKTDDIQEDTSNEFGVNDCNAKLEVGSGKPDNLDVLLVSEVKDEAHDVVVLGENFENTDDIQEYTSNEFGADDCNAKLEVGSGKPDNLDVLLVSDVKDEAHDVVLGENFKKSTDNEITDANGPADVPVTQLSPETENSNGDQDMEQEDSLAVKTSDDVSMVVEIQSSLSQETNTGSELNEAKDDYHGNSASELKSTIEEGSDDENLSVFQENKKSDIEAEVEQKVLEAAVLPEEQICFEHSDIKKLGTPEFESNATDAFPDDTDFENDRKESMNVEDPVAEMEKYNTEALVDVHVMAAEDVAMKNFECSSPCQEKTPCQAKESMPKIEEFANSETLVAVYVMSEAGFSMAADEGFPSSDKTQMDIKERSPYPFSSPLASQLPRPQLTPRKSSSKKQTTIQKSIHVLDENKENSDSSCCAIVELKKEGKEEQVLHQMSLRRLTKLYKERLIKTDPKNCEDKNVTKQQVGKTRPALKTLPENCMAANEVGKDN